MKEISERAIDFAAQNQEFLTVPELSQATQPKDSGANRVESANTSANKNLPVVEINDSSNRRGYSHSAGDLGAPIERTLDPSSLVSKPIDPRSIVFRIGRGTPQPYYDKYAAGLSVTVSNTTSSSPELNGRTNVSVGLGAEYANPSTRIQLYVQPVGTEQRYGVGFSTNF